MLNLRHWNLFDGHLVEARCQLSSQPAGPVHFALSTHLIRSIVMQSCVASALESATSHSAPVSPFIISGCDILGGYVCGLPMSLGGISARLLEKQKKRREDTHLTCYAVSNLVSMRGQLAWRAFATLVFAGPRTLIKVCHSMID